MRDPRRFHVTVDGEVRGTGEVLAARLGATKLVLRGERGVRLVNERTDPARDLAAECLRLAAGLVEDGDLLAARCVLGDVHELLDDLASREPAGTHGPIERLHVIVADVGGAR
jgi:hypothetical protein